MYYLIKTILTAIIIVIVSEIAKKSSFLAAIIISIPITSLLAFIWLYLDTKDTQKIVVLSYGTLIMTIPSFAFFLILPLMLKLKQIKKYCLNFLQEERSRICTLIYPKKNLKKICILTKLNKIEIFSY